MTCLSLITPVAIQAHYEALWRNTGTVHSLQQTRHNKGSLAACSEESVGPSLLIRTSYTMYSQRRPLRPKMGPLGLWKTEASQPPDLQRSDRSNSSLKLWSNTLLLLLPLSKIVPSLCSFNEEESRECDKGGQKQGRGRSNDQCPHTDT